MQQIVEPFRTDVRPSCRCGAYMRIWTVEPLVTDPGSEAHVFACDVCGHKFHLLRRVENIADGAAIG
jgi:hypothetical protein